MDIKETNRLAELPLDFIQNPFPYNLATEHLDYSLSKITDGDYAGQHWLGSFALHAFKTKIEAQQ